MALKGTLKDFGVADIFQLIGQQQKTGVLHLIEAELEVHVSFKDGNVVRAESATRKKKELLGDMLVRSGLIGDRQLQDALEEQKRTLMRLGDILVASGAMTREALRDMALLQTSETMYRLFSWKAGYYEFEVVEVEFDPETMTPLRPESLLMEGFRRIDEWPMIRKKIASPAVTFQRLKPLPEEASGGEDVDSALDDAFDAFDGPKKPSPPKESGGEFRNLGSNERLVYGLATPGVDVQFIADRSRLGEFEASKALLNLINLGCLRALSPVNKGAGAVVARGRWGMRFVLICGRLAMGLVLLGAVALISTRIELRESGERRLSEPASKRLAGQAQQARLDNAIAVFALRKGRAPEALKELVSHGILSEADLRYPWGQPYYYRKTGTSTYVLLPPVR